MGIPNEIIFGAGAIAAVHALIPNHWIPLVAIARTEKWSWRSTLTITAAVATFHVLGTILAGFAIALLGNSILTKLSVAHDLPQYILILFGLFFIWSGIRHNRRCRHHSLKLVGGDPSENNLTRRFGLVCALSLSMFLSPCVDILGFFLSVSIKGWPAIIAVASIFSFVTIPLLVGLVAIGMLGVDRMNWKIFDHHGRTITGIFLLILGALGFIWE